MNDIWAVLDCRLMMITTNYIYIYLSVECERIVFFFSLSHLLVNFSKFYELYDINHGADTFFDFSTQIYTQWTTNPDAKGHQRNQLDMIWNQNVWFIFRCIYSQFLMVIYVIDHYWRLSFLNKLWRREYQIFRVFFLLWSTRIGLLCPVLNSIWAQQAILAFRYFFYERPAAILCELYRLSVYTYRAVWWELV